MTSGTTSGIPSTTAGSGLRPVVFEDFVIGETFGPIELDVDDFFIRQHAFTTGDYHPWFLDGSDSPFGGRVAPASSLLAEMLRLLNTRYDPLHDRGLHQREEVWFHTPARLGERVRLTGELTETYRKRGRGYFVVEAEARTVDTDRLICRHRAVEAVEIGDPERLGGGTGAGTATRRVVGVYPDGVPVAATARPDVTAGTPLPVLEKTVHQAQISVFSNVARFWHTTHTDIAVAREEGLDTPIAQGLMMASYASELATRFFGATWHTTGHLNLAFVAPLFPEDTVRVHGVVSGVEPEGGGARVEIEVWVENAADGRKLTVGWADAVVGPGSAT